MRAERVENTFVLSVDGAFDGLPSHGTVQTGYLRGLMDLVRSRGCDPRKVLEHHEIDSRTFEDPDQHIKCASAVNLLESWHGPPLGRRQRGNSGRRPRLAQRGRLVIEPVRRRSRAGLSFVLSSRKQHNAAAGDACAWSAPSLG